MLISLCFYSLLLIDSIFWLSFVVNGIKKVVKIDSSLDDNAINVGILLLCSCC